MTQDASRDGLAESFGEWTLSYSVQHADAGLTSWIVQIELDGAPRARLSLSNSGLADPQAMAALREKARRWIVDFESRPHAGDTDFGAL